MIQVNGMLMKIVVHCAKKNEPTAINQIRKR